MVCRHAKLNNKFLVVLGVTYLNAVMTPVRSKCGPPP